MDLINVDVTEMFDINALNVDTKVLGEGAYGCVLKSVDGKYAIKLQEITARDKCQYESSLQQKLSEVVLDAAVARVYFYDANMKQIPLQWRDALSQGCKKAPAWAQKSWNGRFCVTVMDFLPGDPPSGIHPYNFPLFCFSLLYTVSVGYEKIKFQHLDIKTGNIVMVPFANESMTYYSCNISSAFTFRHATLIPKLVDFGISTSVDIPPSINVQENRGGTLMITPFEVIVGRIVSNNPNIKTFMHTDGPQGYHWSYDLVSIAFTILNATLSTNEQDIIGFRMIADVPPYMTGLLQKYGINAQSQEGLHPGMVIMYMYNLCIIQELLGNGRYPNVDDAGFASVYPKNSVGYDLLFNAENRKVIDYIVTKNKSLYASDIERLKQTYGKVAFSLVASLLRWNPEKRGGGKGQVLKDVYFIPFRSNRDCGPQEQPKPRPKPQPQPQQPKQEQPQPQAKQPKERTWSILIFLVDSSPRGGGEPVAYLKRNPQTNQYDLFAGCTDVESFVEGKCTVEDLKKMPNLTLSTSTEAKKIVLMKIQNKRMRGQDQLTAIDLATLIQLAMATKSGNVVKKGSVVISSLTLTAIRNLKKLNMI